MCGTPVIQFTDEEKKIIVNNEKLDSPFLPKSKDPKVGSIVVARINDEVTVKTLIEISQSKVILRPENQNYEDITINPQVDELAFEGSCVALLRESI